MSRMYRVKKEEYLPDDNVQDGHISLINLLILITCTGCTKTVKLDHFTWDQVRNIYGKVANGYK